MENKFTLNDNQLEACRHLLGPMMVLAGPGSGKTAVITHRAKYMTSYYHVDPKNMLVITYSKAAADQMRRRYIEIGGENATAFGTFHAIFYRILRERWGYGPDNLVSDDERRWMIKQMLAAMKYDMEEEFVSQVLNEMSLVRNELIELKSYHPSSLGTEDFILLANQYESYKNEKNKIDFDDMLCLCYKTLREETHTKKKWADRYRYIMIDEFQDINRVQYECVKLLAAPSNNLFIVGDDDQGIYRFRGARPEFLLNFNKEFKNAGYLVLDVNYRSTDAIISYANRLISKNRLRFGKSIIGTNREGQDVKKIIAYDQNEEAAKIATEIKQMHKKGMPYDSFAVIYRVNMQSRAFVDAFLHLNIPFHVKDESHTIYEHWITKDLFAYLRLGNAMPVGYDLNIERIINKPYRFISKAFIQSAKMSKKNPFDIYYNEPTLNDKQRARIEELIMHIKTAGKRPPAEALRYIRRAAGYDTHIKEHSEYRKLDPSGLYEIADEIVDAAKQFNTADDFFTHAQEAIEANKLNKEPRGPCVTLTTMHSAKGLEFETVFIAGAVEGVIPHERSKTEPEIEEERRLMYVGITRAMSILYFSIIKTKYDKEIKQSRFII